MTRTITAAAQTQLDADHLAFTVLVQLDFDEGTLRLNVSGQDVAWNGFSWTGAGALSTIEAVPESTSLAAQDIRIGLSGIPMDLPGFAGSPTPASLVELAEQSHYQGRAAKIWFALLDSGYVVVADPILVFDGRMDSMSISLGETADIMLTLQSRLADWDRARVRRYNDADQRAEYPDDVGFEFVERMVEKQLVWGAAPPPPTQEQLNAQAGATLLRTGKLPPGYHR